MLFIQVKIDNYSLIGQVEEFHTRTPTLMDHTFGTTLLHFSYSCELIDDTTFLRFRELILSYTGKVLEIDVDRIFIESDFKNQKILYPLGLAKQSKYQPIPVIDTSTGKYFSLAGLAYGKMVPLWVISKDPKESDLRTSTQKVDLWSEEPALPSYFNTHDHFQNDNPPKTTILIPLCRDNVCYGVHSFETSERLETTLVAKDELKLITTAMCNVYIANLHFKKRMQQTQEACKQLDNFIQKPLPVLTKPKIFLASSHRADPRIINMIRKVINEEFKDTFKLEFWQDFHESGNINVHLLRLLSKCRFGICYFSEEVKGANGCRTYQDNPNVIFEAGMLHSRSVNNVDFPADWVPIREKDTILAPFDFGSERMIIVPRNTLGNLETRKFRTTLKKHLNELIPQSARTRHQQTRVA